MFSHSVSNLILRFYILDFSVLKSLKLVLWEEIHVPCVQWMLLLGRKKKGKENKGKLGLGVSIRKEKVKGK